MKIALIGAGPRGLLLLNRLLAWQPHTNREQMTITIYDPYPIGGRVWRTDQDPHLLMNTAANQITLFYDQTVVGAVTFTPGPDLASWSRQDAAAFLKQHHAPTSLQQTAASLEPNDYAPRALYGYYQRWYYQQLTHALSEEVRVFYRQTTVSAIEHRDDDFTVATASESQRYDGIVLALGNSENTLTREQERLAAFAKRHRYLYLPPNFPAEGDLSSLSPKDVVIIRGLGLSAHDFLNRLTTGRGGRFTISDNGLVYHPSGREPHLVAGSRRGFPYHAKGRNQKAPGQQTTARFTTTAQLDTWQATGKITGSTFMTAMRHDVEFTYYSRLLASRHQDPTWFQLAFTTDPDKALAALELPEADRLNWQALIDPPGDTDWQQTIQAFLERDIADAQLGTLTGPLTSALEVLRDLRDQVRQLLERELLSDDEYLDWFLRKFNGLNNFLSIGPPRQRNAELLALIQAGIVTLLPPGMQVQGAHGHFIATSSTDATVAYRGTALIEARVPAVNAPTAKNPLIQQLLHAGYATPYELQLDGERRFQSGALLVDRQTHQLLDAAHKPQGQLYCWGVPTEGVHWLTNASPRPLVNDISLRNANEIAKALLNL
ncbi:FAD/NAD(P)-binding protein [Lacticaseibacillus sp. GG6-2]